MPAILEYLPYRKRDGTIVRDHLTHPYFAGHGYACVRVDMRGCGEADGVLEDEYSEQEQDDGVEVIDWIAAQDWCTGKVGMMGISWGGFNGLQIAALEPEPLKAIITLCSTDDRYADDIHYKGGCLLNENLGWGATMLAYSSRAPDPLLYGEKWYEAWMERLEAEPFLSARWLKHQRRDSYWKHGSVCEDYSRIKAAVLAVGGWNDAYSNAIPRMINGMTSPVRAIIGPWTHKYPHFAVPEPRIGFLQEALQVVGFLAQGRGHRRAARPGGARLHHGQLCAAGPARPPAGPLDSRRRLARAVNRTKPALPDAGRPVAGTGRGNRARHLLATDHGPGWR